MALDKYLMELEVKSLIEIIEKPENQGIKKPNTTRAKDELDDRNVSPEKIKALVIEVNQAIAYDVIMNEEVTKEEVSMHKSKFLTTEEIKNIYIEQVEKYIKYKDQFQFDVWSYAIGGV